jgi:endonuclease/exonuclease/phosphatase family metal-dependent hydrolase
MQTLAHFHGRCWSVLCPIGVTLNDALAGVELDQQLSFHDFTGKAFAAVDTIYYDSRISLRQVKVDTEQWEGVWPSDHFPVVAEFVVTPEMDST